MGVRCFAPSRKYWRYACTILSLETSLIAPLNVAILILRIYVMYGCNKRLLWALSTMLLTQIVTELVILVPIAQRTTSGSSSHIQMDLLMQKM